MKKRQNTWYPWRYIGKTVKRIYIVNKRSFFKWLFRFWKTWKTWYSRLFINTVFIATMLKIHSMGNKPSFPISARFSVISIRVVKICLCVMQDGSVTCERERCGQTCEHPISNGECCPPCESCDYQGQWYHNGESRKVSKCRTCQCRVNLILKNLCVHCRGISLVVRVDWAGCKNVI